MKNQTERKRQTQSCDRCRQRKRKCDDGHPCQNCVKASATCTFTKTQAKRGPKISPSKVDKADKQNTLENMIQIPIDISQTSMDISQQENFPFYFFQDSNVSANQPSIIPDTLEHIFLEEELKKKENDLFFTDSNPFLEDSTDYQWSQVKLKDIHAPDWSSLPLESCMDLVTPQQVVFDDEKDTFFGSLDLQQLDLLL